MAKNEMLLVAKNDLEQVMRTLTGLFHNLEDMEYNQDMECNPDQDAVVALGGKFHGMADALMMLGLVEVAEYRYMIADFDTVYDRIRSC